MTDSSKSETRRFSCERTPAKVVSALMSHINQADGHYSSFSSELTEVAEGLSNDVTADNLNSLIDRAMRATNTALERGAE